MATFGFPGETRGGEDTFFPDTGDRSAADTAAAEDTESHARSYNRLAADRDRVAILVYKSTYNGCHSHETDRLYISCHVVAASALAVLASVSASAVTEVLEATAAGWGWASRSRSGQISAARHQLPQPGAGTGTRRSAVCRWA